MKFTSEELQTMIDLCTMQIVRLDDGITLLPHRATEFKNRIATLLSAKNKLEIKLLNTQDNENN